MAAPDPTPELNAAAVDMAGIALRAARFRAEAASHGLRYRCRDCVHVVPSTVTCSMFFPNGMLRDVDGPFQPDGSYAFCKYFELGEG